jgi:hypothetical protein
MNHVIGQITATFVGQAPTCPQDSDGSLCCTSITGGIPPYNCAITFPAGSFTYNSVTNCFVNMPSGPYTILITDNFGNSGTVNTIVPPSQYPPLVINATITDATCGQANGSACCTVTGGTGNYTYQWIRFSDFQILGNGLCLSNLDPNDSYSFTVYDGGSPCFASVQIVVQENNLALSASTTNSTCTAPNCNGAIDFTANGTAPFIYSWNGPGVTSVGTEDLSGLCAGTYTVNVTDANGCTGTASYTLSLEGADVIIGGTGTAANVITANTTWNPAYFGGQTTIIVDADVVVNAGVSLTINNLIVLVTPGHCIRANNLSSIMTNNSTFDVICGDTWYGFEILGGGSTAAITNRGYLNMNNCVTRHAECAIRNNKPVGYPYPYSSHSDYGGNIEAINSIFEDNIFDLDLRNFTSNSNNNRSAKFENCNFLLNQLPESSYTCPFVNCTNTTFPLSTSDPIVRAGFLGTYQRILCVGINRALFQNCQIINYNPIYSNNNVSPNIVVNSVGVRVNNASLIWNGSDPGEQYFEANYESIISGWRRGILITASSTAHRTNISNTLFQCNQGINSSGAGTLDVRNNIFQGYSLPGFIHPGGLGPNVKCIGVRMYNWGNSLNNVNSQEYTIAHNLFSPPTAISAWGVEAYACGSANNYIIENMFVNCYRGIASVLTNRNIGGTSGLRYECNTFISNVSATQEIRDIEILGGQNYIGTPTFDRLGTASPQGRTYDPMPSRSAGNNFINSVDSDTGTGVLLDDINSTATTIPSHSYLVHPTTEVNPLHHALNGGALTGLPEMTSGAHTPVWQDILENQCGYNWLPQQPNIQNLNNLRTSKELLEEAYTALVDGGDTQSLLFEIDASTYQNALDLFTELMSKSPNLSQEVLIETIQKEYDLPKPLLAILLQNNPQAAKDDKVLQALEDRNDPLSSFQLNQMLSGKYWFGSKEFLTQQISATKAQIEKELFALQITELSWENFCELLDESIPNEAKHKADYLAHHGEISTCLALLNNISQVDGENAASLAPTTYGKLLQIQWSYYQNSHVLSADNHTELLNIWNNNTENLGDLAYLYLIIFAGYEALDEDINEVRALEYTQTTTEDISATNTLKLWPNPAQNFVHIQLENQINEDTRVQVFDLFGKEVLNLTLHRLQTELIIDLIELPMGRYVARISNHVHIAPVSFLKQ